MRLLRVYPPAWRARYGEEFAAVIEQLEASGQRMSLPERAEIVRAGLSERLRAFGLGGLPPQERAREGSLRMLYAWMLFVLGGFGVQRASEHWQGPTPLASRELPAVAFDVLVVVAALTSALVLAGVVAAVPRLVELVRGGGWSRVRAPILRAVALSVLLVAGTAALATWAHSLNAAQRNGHDLAYGAAFLLWVLLAAVVLWSWGAAAAAAARAAPLPPSLLRVEAKLAVAVSAAMALMTLAAAVWWGAVAASAPWFFSGAQRIGSSSATVVPANMIVPVALMVTATALGASGAIRARAELPQDA